MVSDGERIDKAALLAHTTKIAAAYVSNNTVAPQDIPDLLETIYSSLIAASEEIDETQDNIALEPAVPIDESLSDEAIICLEDGLSFQSLKRHLRVKYDMTPEAYRKKWGLPADYPMVAPAYARRRSELAKRTGLGKNRP